MSQRSLDPITGRRYHSHDHLVATNEIKQRLIQHPTDNNEIVRKRYEEYMIYRDELQEFYSQQDAIHVPADQDAYAVFEAIESGILNPLSKDKY